MSTGSLTFISVSLASPGIASPKNRGNRPTPAPAAIPAARTVSVVVINETRGWPGQLSAFHQLDAEKCGKVGVSRQISYFIKSSIVRGMLRPRSSRVRAVKRVRELSGTLPHNGIARPHVGSDCNVGLAAAEVGEIVIDRYFHRRGGVLGCEFAQKIGARYPARLSEAETLIAAGCCTV